MLSAIIALAMMPVEAEILEYRIAAGGNNRIVLEVEKTGLMRGKKHTFEFPKFEGVLFYDREQPANSRVELKIDSASIVCRDAWLSPSDLKKVTDYALEEMLAVRKYPQMRFQSSTVTRQSDGTFVVDGTLTIRGIGKPVQLRLSLDPVQVKAEGKAVLKMTSYGLKPPSAALGLIGTKDEMTASFQIAAAR